jgi:hypothetical protein
MKKILVVLMLCWLALSVTGCGGGGDGGPPVFVRNILSAPTVDGDVEQDSVTGSLTVTQVARDAVPSVLAGVDPATLNELRAFLHFPLGSIPTNAIIRSATLDIFIDSIRPIGGLVPIRIELVSFPPPLLGTDFDRLLLPPLAFTTISPPISAADVNRHVVIDVTDLMRAAQANALPSFQVRILEDFGFVSPGLIEIDDTSTALAPLLRVVFF